MWIVKIFLLKFAKNDVFQIFWEKTWLDISVKFLHQAIALLSGIFPGTLP